uniref:Uncharacterized protein n=1 Tax=Periophthalmus magnuspinnatus TaxID=409849 RepID=A0A3B4B1T1_9GOBI
MRCVGGGFHGDAPHLSLHGNHIPTMPEQSNDYSVVVFGAGGVGKSSLVLRFVKGTFRDTYIPTVEDTYRQVLSLTLCPCRCSVSLSGLAGAQSHSLVLQVLSLTLWSCRCSVSLSGLAGAQSHSLVLQVLSLTLWSCRCSQNQGEAQAKLWKCAFMETSAKTNHNVTELFQELLSLEKKRDMSLSIDGKRGGKQTRADKLKGKCSVM